MVMLNKVLSVALGAVAAFVVFHFVGMGLYEDTLDLRTVCSIAYALSAPAILVALAVNYRRGGMYWWGSALLTIWFYSHWLVFLKTPLEETEVHHMVLWSFIEPLIILVLGATSAHLWKGSDWVGNVTDR